MMKYSKQLQALSSSGTSKPTTEEIRVAHMFVIALYGGQKETLLDL